MHPIEKITEKKTQKDKILTASKGLEWWAVGRGVGRAQKCPWVRFQFLGAYVSSEIQI